MRWIRLAEPPASGPFNFSRKFYHMLGLFVPFWLYFDVLAFLDGGAHHLSRFVGVLLLAGFVTFMVVFDTLRFSNATLNRFFTRVVGPLLKEEEHDRYNATIPYFLACLILFLFCSPEVVMLSCIFLMVGDPFAAYAGMYYGRLRFWNGKSLEGLLAFIVFGLLGSLIFLWWNGEHDLSGSVFTLTLDLMPVVVSGVIAAAVAEFFSVIGLRGIMDDNLVVPLAGAIGLIIVGVSSGIPFASLLFDPRTLFQ
ncbi:MAG: hypothetical protein H7A21_05280 [Spirochaetales bacterium]|nr:hypothetical protein [Leptospiraceae bacterium]MCP5480827.1 hypothetical protein [Spirochaetales bacterium]